MAGPRCAVQLHYPAGNRDRKYILVIGLGFLHFQNFYGPLRNTHCAVGVLRFQERFHNLAIDPGHLAADFDDSVLPVNLIPLEP